MGSIGDPLGPSWDPLGTLLDPLGTPLDPRGTLLDTLGTLLGSLGDPFGPSWDPLGPFGTRLDPLWCIVDQNRRLNLMHKPRRRFMHQICLLLCLCASNLSPFEECFSKICVTFWLSLLSSTLTLLGAFRSPLSLQVYIFRKARSSWRF